MSVAALSEYAVQASAIATASAAIYCARVARDVHNQVRENTMRSKRNRKYLTGKEDGDETPFEGLFERVEEVRTEVRGGDSSDGG